MQVYFDLAFRKTEIITYFFVAISLKMSQVKYLALILRKILHQFSDPGGLIRNTALNEGRLFLDPIKIVVPAVMFFFS